MFDPIWMVVVVYVLGTVSPCALLVVAALTVIALFGAVVLLVDKTLKGCSDGR